jgi:thymidylate kinase
MGQDNMIAFDRSSTLTENQRKLEQLPVLDLIKKLCNTLAVEKIDYCHWKSNAALNRSASGDNDLDLLVSRIHAQKFTEILYVLGFKEVLAPKVDELPGVRNYYGYDLKSGRLIHVHAHFQLILGSDLSKNYRLPLERVYLGSSFHGALFRLPSPEFEFVIFVIRMILKHSTWESILMRHSYLSPSEQRELDYLSTPDMIVKARVILHYMPGLSDNLFDKCLQALQPDCSLWTRIKVGEQLQKVLCASARYPHLYDVIVKFAQRFWQPVQKRVFRYEQKNRIASGGLFIAIVGGDGAGKTTTIDEVFIWLSEKFKVTKVHMGKPDWSWATIVIRGILKIGTILRLYPFEGDVYEEFNQSHSYSWFIRAVCTARDRYLTYLQARRLSSNGELVLCDRFSFPNFMTMDGPQCGQAITHLERVSRFHNHLAKLEISYYEQIRQPDLLIVLKVEPELAVKRKQDESEVAVHARSTEVWELDWREKSAFVVDASLTREEVISQVKALVWAHL